MTVSRMGIPLCLSATVPKQATQINQVDLIGVDFHWAMWTDIFKFIANLFCSLSDTQPQGQQYPSFDKWQQRSPQKHQVYIPIASPFYKILFIIIGCESD